jgi:hypothetical protein
MEAGRQIMLVAQKAAGKDEPKADDMFEVGCVSSILQMLKLPDGTVKVLVEGVQRANTRSITETRRVLRRRSRAGAAGRRAVARDRGAAPRRDAAVRPVRQAQQEDPARDPDQHRRHRRSGPPGRHHRRAPAAQARGQAVGAGPVRGRQAAGEAARTAGARGRHPAGGKAHPRPRQAADGEEPARVLPQRAGQGHPEGTGRRRRRRRPRGTREEDQGRAHEQGSAQEGRGRAEEAQADVADVGRSHGGAQLHRHLVNLPWAKKTKIKHDLPTPRTCSTKTTTAWRRSRTASSSTSRCSSASTRSRRPSCAWWAPRAWARPRWARAWRAPPAASSCAWRWAACATRPRSAATAAPTSAACRARCCRA